MAELFELGEQPVERVPEPRVRRPLQHSVRSRKLNLGSENIIVEVLDMSGKAAISQEMTSGGRHRRQPHHGQAQPRCWSLHLERDPQGLLRCTKLDCEEVRFSRSQIKKADPFWVGFSFAPTSTLC